MNSIYLRNNEFFDHVYFLEILAKWIKPETYLELGINDGSCFTRIAPYCKRAIGVDIVPIQFELPSNAVYEQMYTDDYFIKIKSSNLQFDMVFIDADHSFEQSYQDFLNVKDLVTPDGFVFFHDTYPFSPVYLDKTLCSDSYKTAITIRENFHNEWEIVTLPFNPGVTIAKKVYNKTGLPWMK